VEGAGASLSGAFSMATVEFSAGMQSIQFNIDEGIGPSQHSSGSCPDLPWLSRMVCS